jgi:hypothetical protein
MGFERDGIEEKGRGRGAVGGFGALRYRQVLIQESSIRKDQIEYL